MLIAGHAAATLCMLGVIWFVQLVHYPLFTRVGGASFTSYHEAHTRRTTWVVLPPMLAELASSIALVVRPPEPELAGWLWAGLAGLVVIWLSTALVQVPLHRALARRFDAGTSRLLTKTNWVRTLGWSARSALAIWLCARAAPA